MGYISLREATTSWHSTSQLLSLMVTPAECLRPWSRRPLGSGCSSAVGDGLQLPKECSSHAASNALKNAAFHQTFVQGLNISHKSGTDRGKLLLDTVLFPSSCCSQQLGRHTQLNELSLQFSLISIQKIHIPLPHFAMSTSPPFLVHVLNQLNRHQVRSAVHTCIDCFLPNVIDFVSCSFKQLLMSYPHDLVCGWVSVCTLFFGEAHAKQATSLWVNRQILRH